MTERVALMASRHSAFYAPLLGTFAGGFLADEGLEASYDVLTPGMRSRTLLRDGSVDVFQSAVGSNFGPHEKGETDLPVHFAQINRRDGFLLASRDRRAGGFEWKQLEGRRLLADHGGQPMLMFRYALNRQGVSWDAIDVIDAGEPDAMARAFRGGEGDYVHLQGPAPQQLEEDGAARVVACVGDAMPSVAFSSLCATRSFLETERAAAFMRAYRRSRRWAQEASPAEIAANLQTLFPDVSPLALTHAIERYQQLGCWQGDVEIPAELYDQAVEVFRAGGAIERAPSYREVVRNPPV